RDTRRLAPVRPQDQRLPQAVEGERGRVRARCRRDRGGVAPASRPARDYGAAARPRARARLMLQSIISVIFIGFVTGALARFALPGPDPMPAWLTVVIGLAGTLIGAGIAFAIAGKDPVWLQMGELVCSVLIVGG